MSHRRKCNSAPIVIMGIGNILLGDEGVGVRVIEAMQQRGVPPGTELVDAGTAGADLVEIFADRQKAIVVDALDGQRPPGTVFRLSGSELIPEPGQAVSLHQLGFVESLIIAQRLGCEPQEVIVFGIQPEQIRPGLELSDAVEQSIPVVIQAIHRELQQSCHAVSR